MVRCPLCGNQFDAAQSPACQACPSLFRGCGMTSCPRCSHEFPVVAAPTEKRRPALSARILRRLLPAAGPTPR